MLTATKNLKVDFVPLKDCIFSRNLSNLNFSVVPVNFERKKLLDDWEDMTLVGKPVLSKYSAKISVDFDTDYVIRVRAITHYVLLALVLGFSGFEDIFYCCKQSLKRL